MNHRPRIAITLGDPAGIGPEVIVKGLERVLSFASPLVIGNFELLQRLAGEYAPSLKLTSIKSLSAAHWKENSVDVLDSVLVPDTLKIAQASKEGGQAAVDSIKQAVQLALSQEVDAITTAPINKEALHLAGHFFPGHTELLAELTNTRHVALMLAGGNLRVVLTTTHVPLEDVKKLITKDRILDTLKVTHDWLTRMGMESPHIAVTGLNPHCGDGGIFGEEESASIQPAIDEARTNGWNVSGPHSADALFGRLDAVKPDAVITMYHDQGMIPIKMASMGHAVNITLGLPIIRTSVDHGTAFDIAGQNRASADSLVQAVEMAAHLARSQMATK